MRPSKRTSIVWIDRDTRLRDNAALFQAFEEQDRVVPVYVHAPESEGDAAPGAASRWWRHHSLAAFDGALRARSSRLTIRRGDPLEEIQRVAETTRARAVYWNERLTPASRRRDAHVRTPLREDGLDVRIFRGPIVHDPDRIRTTSGGPYHVFTPFWKKLKQEISEVRPLPAPPVGPGSAPHAWPESLSVDDLDLLPRANWDAGLHAHWTPGEEAGLDRLEAFIDADLLDYETVRDRPDLHATSQLSPYLAHGDVGIREVWARVDDWVQNGVMRAAADAFLRQLAWREFSYHLLYHYPETTSEPLKSKFKDFEWVDDDELLERWQRGRTGYPIVDAGMRQLWSIGWMHNRVRMIAASFLTKDLRVRWQKGAAWFRDTLVDADLANNTMGWQWSAGSGADAQPFFRIFNPVTQGARFDPEGAFVRRWIPELSELPADCIHRPWTASEEALAQANVTLGETYPYPVVDHGKARKASLKAYEAVK
ncbi:MAG: deoxyribodipyrimidine photo-lyase [Rhodothermales bacterium]